MQKYFGERYPLKTFPLEPIFFSCRKMHKIERPLTDRGGGQGLSGASAKIFYVPPKGSA